MKAQNPEKNVEVGEENGGGATNEDLLCFGEEQDSNAAMEATFICIFCSLW